MRRGRGDKQVFNQIFNERLMRGIKGQWIYPHDEEGIPYLEYCWLIEWCIN